MKNMIKDLHDKILNRLDFIDRDRIPDLREYITKALIKISAYSRGEASALRVAILVSNGYDFKIPPDEEEAVLNFTIYDLMQTWLINETLHGRAEFNTKQYIRTMIEYRMKWEKDFLEILRRQGRNETEVLDDNHLSSLIKAIASDDDIKLFDISFDRDENEWSVSMRTNSDSFFVTGSTFSETILSAANAFINMD